jgi:hypothetical protein
MNPKTTPALARALAEPSLMQPWPFPQVTIFSLEQVPVRVLDPSNAADKPKYDRMVALVEQMLLAQKQLPGAHSDADKDFYENKCVALDRQIDALVYELYSLTEDEIKIVEGAHP